MRGAQYFRSEGRAGRLGIDLEHALRDPTYRDNLILFAGPMPNRARDWLAQRR